MKVISNFKGALSLKSTLGEIFSLEEGKHHTFSKGEYGLYKKSVEGFVKMGLLVTSMDVAKVEEPVLDAVVEPVAPIVEDVVAPVVDTPSEVVEPVAKVVKPAKKVTKKKVSRRPRKKV